MLVLGGDFPVLIAFSLAPEFPVARFAPHVRFSVEEVLIQLYPGSETKKTREASIVVAENMVVLQMHLERKWSKEGAQTEIALDLVVRRVIDVVPQGVAVLKHSLAQAAVVLMHVRRQLHVCDKPALIQERKSANTTEALLAAGGLNAVAVRCRLGGYTPILLAADGG